MNEQSLASLRKIEANQKEIIKQNYDALDQKEAQLTQERNELDRKAAILDNALYQELHRQVEVSVDLAIKSLPWWKRSVGRVMLRAYRFQNEMKSCVQLMIDNEIINQKSNNNQS